MLYFVCTSVVINICMYTIISAEIPNTKQVCVKNPTCDVIKNDKLVIQKKNVWASNRQEFNAKDANASQSTIDIHPDNLESNASLENGKKCRNHNVQNCFFFLANLSPTSTKSYNEEKKCVSLSMIARN